MKSEKLRADQRHKSWAKAKSATGAYARNPCAATERLVEDAVDHLRHLNDEAVAKPSPERGND